MLKISRRGALISFFQAATMAIVVAFSAPPSSANALEPDAAKKFVADASVELMALITSAKPIEQKQSEFRVLIERYVAVRDVARLALGNDWTGIDDQQRDRYVDAFVDYLSSTYARRFDEYGGEELELIDAQDHGRKGVMVRSRIAGRPGGGEPINVEWRIMDRNGPLQLFDIYVEGVSLLITQRSEFSQFLDQNGGDVEKLIANLEAKTQFARNDG